MEGLVSSGASLSLCFQMRDAVPASLSCVRMRRCLPQGFAGRVGEWLKPADCKSAAPCGLRRFESSPVHQRSEEHTSELQSPCNLVCRLLLEKKKNNSTPR